MLKPLLILKQTL